MSVKIGTVPTFEGATADKEQAVKVLEEAAEVFGAWQLWASGDLSTLASIREYSKYALVSECCDLIQATCNLLAGLGVNDLTDPMQDCYDRNIKRGRKYDG